MAYVRFKTERHTWGPSLVSPRQQSASDLKLKLADHKLKEKEISVRIIRKRCADCYEKSTEQQSREMSHATAKKIKTFCFDCHKFFLSLLF